MQNTFTHISVLKDEILSFFNPKPDICICDATLGLGGHAEAILEKTEKCTFIGFDADQNAIDLSRKRLARFKDHRIFLINSNYSTLADSFRRLKLPMIDFLYYDLGCSTMQFEDASRGFSFSNNGPLDMRMDKSSDLTAYDIVNSYSEKDLRRIFKEYGEDKDFSKIAKGLIQKRSEKKIQSTTELAEIICNIKKIPPWKQKINPATKIFQAIRIEVNSELQNLRKSIKQAIPLLNPKGRIAMISFHSLEDRIVKEEFKLAASKCICDPNFPICKCNHAQTLKILTKSPITPSKDEVEFNLKARSAKLRVGEKI